jgi:hypothetical protein
MSNYVVPEQSKHLIEHGLKNVNFTEQVDLFKPNSQKQYMKTATEFLQFILDYPLSEFEASTLTDGRCRQAVNFLKFKRGVTQATPLLSGSTLQTKWSHVLLFFMTVYKIDLTKEVTVCQKLLNSWKAEDPDPTQAAVFSLEQLQSYYSLPLALHSAHIAVYAVMATHGCERGCESKLLHYEDIQRLVNPTNEATSYQVTFNRQKQLGKSFNKRQVIFMITSADAVGIIDRYIDLTPFDSRSGRFYRYNEWNNSTNSWFISAKVVGDQTLSKCAKQIAASLSLENVSAYTGFFSLPVLIYFI